jgi:hypothetical protein
MYIAEVSAVTLMIPEGLSDHLSIQIAPSSIRGSLVALQQLAITLGVSRTPLGAEE